MEDLKTIIVNLLIFVVVVIAAYFTARYISQRSMKASRSRHMRVTDRLALSRDKAVYLVKVGDEYFLLGATNQQINVLGKPEIEEEEDAGDKKQSSSFAAFMAKAVHKKETEQKDRDETPDGAGEKKGFGLKKARRAWEDLLRKKRENEEALRRYRTDQKKRKEEDE